MVFQSINVRYVDKQKLIKLLKSLFKDDYEIEVCMLSCSSTQPNECSGRRRWTGYEDRLEHSEKAFKCKTF